MLFLLMPSLFMSYLAISFDCLTVFLWLHHKRCWHEVSCGMQNSEDESLSGEKERKRRKLNMRSEWLVRSQWLLMLLLPSHLLLISVNLSFSPAVLLFFVAFSVSFSLSFPLLVTDLFLPLFLPPMSLLSFLSHSSSASCVGQKFTILVLLIPAQKPLTHKETRGQMFLSLQREERALVISVASNKPKALLVIRRQYFLWPL